MNQSEYLKCPCQSCGQSIEFPANGVGRSTACPHCSHATLLTIAPEPESPTDAPLEAMQSKSKSHFPWLLVVAVVVIAGVGAVFALKHKSPDKTAEDIAPSSKEVEPSTATRKVPAAANGARSIDDLKTIGTIALEKAKGSSLVHAVGILKNNSDLQRFGVTIELALLDERGNAAGTAKDYRSVIEPRDEWRFRALVLYSKAVSAKVSRISEEE